VDRTVREAVEGAGEKLEYRHEAEEELGRLIESCNGQRLRSRPAFLWLVDYYRRNPVVLHARCGHFVQFGQFMGR
jgi:hypothetical protein